MDRMAELAPLGTQRLRVLDCLGGNAEHAPGYFALSAEADVFAEFRGYVARIAERWGAEADPSTASLIGAARLLIGDLDGAGAIIDHLPVTAVRLDHGAGYCLVVPIASLRSALPLPETLQDTGRWIRGSAAQAALRGWVDDHRDRLRWDERSGVYVL